VLAFAAPRPADNNPIPGFEICDIAGHFVNDSRTFVPKNTGSRKRKISMLSQTVSVANSRSHNLDDYLARPGFTQLELLERKWFIVFIKYGCSDFHANSF
jgi:hypothetical protein